MWYNEFKAEDEIIELIEETFNKCESNKDEILWLIALLRGFMNIPNKCTEPVENNYRLNYWQYTLHPILEKYKKRWKCSNYGRKEKTW